LIPAVAKLLSHRAALPIAALAAFVAGCAITFLLLQPRIGLAEAQTTAVQATLRTTVAEYGRLLAEGETAAERERARVQKEADDATAEKDAEISRLAAAAARIPDVVRVRVPGACAVPAPGGDPPGAPQGAGAQAGGVLHDATVGVDIQRLRALASEADALNAAYRAVLRACR
jgi:hypothetical protein